MADSSFSSSSFLCASSKLLNYIISEMNLGTAKKTRTEGICDSNSTHIQQKHIHLWIVARYLLSLITVVLIVPEDRRNRDVYSYNGACGEKQNQTTGTKLWWRIYFCFLRRWGLINHSEMWDSEYGNVARFKDVCLRRWGERLTKFDNI